MVTTENGSSRTYVFGHADDELSRLQRQGGYYRDATESALKQAGVRPGMRVLDIGTGAGDVALLAAELVGPTGQVIGIDKAAEAIEIARQRAARAGIEQVAFVQEDVATFQVGNQVDALVGRMVLMHLPDPVATLRHLVQQVRPLGNILFLEIDAVNATTIPAAPLVERMHGLVGQAFGRAGINPRPGWELHRQFLDAGLPAPEMRYLGRIDPAPATVNCAILAQVVRAALPLIEQFGLATRDEIDLDTLEERMAADLIRHNALIMNPPLVAAWSKRPAL